jgi:hypothetical protein
VGPAGSGAYAEDVPSFAGFTFATFTGNMGGRPNAHAACEAEFGDAHLCHASEYILSNSATPVPAMGAFLDSSVQLDGDPTRQGSHLFGRYTGNACMNYTTTSTSFFATVLQPSGEVLNSSTCQTVRPLACCNGAPKIVFAGFTAATPTGNMGGRPAAHGLCNAAFPGAHLCHASEYLRTSSSMPIPAAGAWVDSSVDDISAPTQQGAPGFGRYTGNACMNYTTTSTSFFATVLNPAGDITNSSTCQNPRSLACCY